MRHSRIPHHCLLSLQSREYSCKTGWVQGKFEYFVIYNEVFWTLMKYRWNKKEKGSRESKTHRSVTSLGWGKSTWGRKFFPSLELGFKSPLYHFCNYWIEDNMLSICQWPFSQMSLFDVINGDFKGLNFFAPLNICPKKKVMLSSHYSYYYSF